METKKKKKRIIIGLIIALVIIGGGAAAAWFFYFRDASAPASAGEETAYVDSVANIAGLGSGNGMQDRFSGVVEPQKTWDVELAQDRKVKDIFVQEGEEVAIGTNLFEYDTADQEESLNQAQIDLERLQNEIDTTSAQIEILEKEKAKASQDDQLDYTTRIQTAQNTIKRDEYDIKKKNVEIEQLKNTIANSIVTSQLDGVVKKINEDAGSSVSSPMYNSGESNAFMTILATGDYRVKGKINEQNMGAIMEGQPVIVRSRVDEERIWKGTVTTIDRENPENGNNTNGGYVSMGNSVSTTGSVNSTNYPFYITLDNADDLMLGQHVYIELDNGQEEAEKKEGIWLDSYYIVQEDGKAHVWASNSKDKLEKRIVTLGGFDEELQKYQILEGLEEDDYITFPSENLKEGMSVVRNVDQIGNMGMNSMPGGMGTDGMDIPSGEGTGADGMDMMPGQEGPAEEGGLPGEADMSGENPMPSDSQGPMASSEDGQMAGPEGEMGSSGMAAPDAEPADGNQEGAMPGQEAMPGGDAGTGQEGQDAPEDVTNIGDGSAPADAAQ